MSLYESIDEFVGEHETLQSVSQYERQTVLLTDTRLVELEHATDGSSPDDVTSLRSIQLTRPSIVGYSAEFGDDETKISLHGESGTTIESLTLPTRDHRFVAVFSAVIGDSEWASVSA